MAMISAGCARPSSTSCIACRSTAPAILCVDDPVLRALVPDVQCSVTSYGVSEDAQVRAVDIRAVGAQMHFHGAAAQRRHAARPMEVVLNLPGHHNVLNALSAIAVAAELNVPDAAVQKALAEFTGRRAAASRAMASCRCRRARAAGTSR
jgi:UDP-N-acetylmuramate-alanine ligase